MTNLLTSLRRLTLSVLPTQIVPYRPAGLWYSGSEYSPLFRLPPPFHPLEALAAYRGAWGRWTGDWSSVIPAGESRTGTFREWLSRIGGYLYYTPEQTALAYHLLTPLVTTGGPDTYPVSAAIFHSLGFPPPEPAAGPVRADFWGGLVPFYYRPLLETL